MTDFRTGRQAPRQISAMPSGVENGLEELQSAISKDDLFDLDEGEYFQILHRAYPAELDYLKTAYVLSVRSSPSMNTRAPSDQIFGHRYGEVDRTVTGLNALRWIYQNDHDSYTQNQPVATKLSQEKFTEMRSLFLNYNQPQEIFTLIMMQMTNDLGKSTGLQSLYHGRPIDEGESEVNHDMMMNLVISNRPDLVPSFLHLPESEKRLVRALTQLSAEFNPAQLIQAECPPEVLNILWELDWNDLIVAQALDRKFLELILDLSGAAGHVHHEGAMTMTQLVVCSLLHALELSKLASADPHNFSPREVYFQVLEHRLKLLRDVDWTGTLNVRDQHDFIGLAMGRLYCMGRADSIQKIEMIELAVSRLSEGERKDLVWGLRIDHRIQRQATYTPGMIASAKTAEQLEVLLRYLARVLFISDCDLHELPMSDDGAPPTDIVIVERDILPMLQPLIKQAEFMDHPSSVVNDSTPLPKLQVLKRSKDRNYQGTQLVGDQPPHRPFTDRCYLDGCALHVRANSNANDHLSWYSPAKGEQQGLRRSESRSITGCSNYGSETDSSSDNS